ncbi:MAG TPA: alpha-ketoacid dehydrogenase subunit beta [Dehalococcoidia bacterium]|nr:alpha-ketoacid dehydrogenase subunit beta [Dehalococcoidia bacterium]
MSQKNFTQAIVEAVSQEMENDHDVFVAGEDVRVGGVFGTDAGLFQKFGEKRVWDTPITEQGITGLAVGAAAAGLRPVIEIMFMDFMGVCMDQIVNQMAKMKYMFGGKAELPIVLRTHSGAGRAMAAQHSQSLEAWFCHVPGLKVVMPSTPYDAKGLLTTSIRDNNPIIFIENKRLLALRGEVPDEQYEIPLGVADVKREGTDVTVVATGYLVQDALQVAEELAGKGVSVEVIDPRTLSPLDMDTIIQSVQKTSRAVVAQEAVTFCGLGAEIAASIQEQAFDYLDAPIKRVGAPFSPVPFSPVLEEAWVPGAAQIQAAIEEIVPVSV